MTKASYQVTLIVFAEPYANGGQQTKEDVENKICIPILLEYFWFSLTGQDFIA